jgi:hypothetical protein
MAEMKATHHPILRKVDMLLAFKGYILKHHRVLPQAVLQINAL